MESNTGLFHPSFFVLPLPKRVSHTFYWSTPHGAGLLLTASPPLPLHPSHPPGIAISTLNIRDGRGFSMAQAIWKVDHRVFDVMLLTKMNISTTAYCWIRIGYNMTFLAARPSRTRGFQGSVGMVTREWPVRWGIESMCSHGPNVVSCKIVTGLTRTPLSEAYLPLSML